MQGLSVQNIKQSCRAEISDLDQQIEQLWHCELFEESEVKVLCAGAREILVEESSVQRVDLPVTVAAMLTDNSMTLNSCSEWVAMSLKPTPLHEGLCASRFLQR